MNAPVKQRGVFVIHPAQPGECELEGEHSVTACGVLGGIPIGTRLYTLVHAVLTHGGVQRTYQGILCHRCGLTSWHQEDVENRYCPGCQVPIDDLGLGN